MTIVIALHTVATLPPPLSTHRSTGEQLLCDKPGPVTHSYTAVQRPLEHQCSLRGLGASTDRTAKKISSFKVIRIAAAKTVCSSLTRMPAGATQQQGSTVRLV